MSESQAAESVLDRLVARVPHWAWRVGGAVWFALALEKRLGTRGLYRSAVLFWLEAAVPGLILAAYLTRPPPVRTARGVSGVLVPFVAAVLPFAFLETPFTAWGWAHLELFAALLVPPTCLMVVSYLALNRSFSVMAEARALVTRGPYAILRHPVYTAQLACGAVVITFRFSWVNLGLYALFMALQYARVRAEEAALAEAFPEAWAAYAARVKRFRP